MLLRLADKWNDQVQIEKWEIMETPLPIFGDSVEKNKKRSCDEELQEIEIEDKKRKKNTKIGKIAFVIMNDDQLEKFAKKLNENFDDSLQYN